MRRECSRSCTCPALNDGSTAQRAAKASLGVGQAIAQRGFTGSEGATLAGGGRAALADPPAGLEGLASVRNLAAVGWQPN